MALDPADTVAQAQLLSLRIEAMQTADDRLAAYDRLLGEAGARLDPSIRSRLALDSALLLREQGEMNGFIERLTLAATLDVTNKEAAALYAGHFLPLVTDPLERAELLGNLILADPVDSSALTNLADELLRQGAYRGAQRMYRLATNLIEGAGERVTPEGMFDRLLADWMVEGDEAALTPLTDLLNQEQAYLNAEARKALEGGEPPPERTEAELPTSLEVIRLGVAFGRRDDEGMRRSAALISRSIRRSLALIAEKKPPFEEITEEQAREATDATNLELLFIRLWGGIELDEAGAVVEDLSARANPGANPGAGPGAEETRVSPDALRRFRGLLAVRRGEYEEAKALLSGQESDRAAAVGLALVAEAEGDTKRAVALLAKVALDGPHSALGAACRRRVETILGRTLQPVPTAESLDRFGRDFAPWLERLTESPHNFMALTVRQATTRPGLFDRIELRVRLKNISTVALSMGPERAINSRLLLTPVMVIEGRPRSPLALAEAINLDRRLRLMPREEVEATVWADRGSSGILLDQNSDRSVSVKWRVTQGPRLGDNGRYTPGTGCLTAESDPARRENIAEPTDAEQVVASLAVAQGRLLLEEILAAAGLSVRRAVAMTESQQQARRTALGDAIGARLADLDDASRAWAIAIGYRAGFLFASEKFVEALAGDRGIFANTAMLLTAYRLPTNQGAEGLLEHPDAAVAELARLAVASKEGTAVISTERLPAKDEPSDGAPSTPPSPPPSPEQP